MTETIMRFALCERCGWRDRMQDDADGVPRMCNGCSAFGANRFIGVTDQEVADQLAELFPRPTVTELGIPLREEYDRLMRALR